MNNEVGNRILTIDDDRHLILRLNIKAVYSIVIALLPVIMIYNVPFVNKGLSTILLGLSLPYAVYVIIRNSRLFPAMISVVVWIGYLIIQSKGNSAQIFLLVVILIHLLAAFNSSLDYLVMRTTIEVVAVICTGLVLIQVLAHYLLKVNIVWLIKGLILEANQDVFNISSGMYRPSALFLEPSHYSQYCCVGLLSALFPVNKARVNLKRAIWIAVGILITTSGMGIMLTVGVFGWYALFSRVQKGMKIGKIVKWTIVLGVAFLLLMQFDFFQNSLQRIFGKVDGYNAIWGRTLYWEAYIGSMSGSDLIWGYGTMNLPEGYMTGLMSLIYQYGCVGFALTIIMFLRLMLFTKSNYAICCCVIFIALLPIANLFKFIQLIFWVSLIISDRIYKREHINNEKFDCTSVGNIN